MTPTAFRLWLRRSMPGARTIYFEGNLLLDRGGPNYRPGPEPTAADLALAAEADGTVLLYQRRVATGRWLYYAQKRRIPRRKWRIMT